MAAPTTTVRITDTCAVVEVAFLFSSKFPSPSHVRCTTTSSTDTRSSTATSDFLLNLANSGGVTTVLGVDGQASVGANFGGLKDAVIVFPESTMDMCFFPWEKLGRTG